MRERTQTLRRILPPIFFISLIASSHATIVGTTFGDTSQVPSQSDSSTNWNFGLVSKAENNIGGDGAAAANLSMLNGIFGTHAHACVKPRAVGTLQSDNADGSALSRITNERFTVTSDSLALDTLIQLTLCIDVTSRLHYDIDGEAQMINANSSGNNYDWTIRSGSHGLQSTGAGSHLYTNFFESVNATGGFAPFAGSETATLMQEVTVTVRVGSYVQLSFEAHSNATVATRALDPATLVYTNAGIGATVGISSAPTGTHLISQTTGTEFFGTCGGSAGAIPPNPHDPVPEPASLALLPLGLAALRAKRKKRSKR